MRPPPTGRFAGAHAVHVVATARHGLPNYSRVLAIFLHRKELLSDSPARLGGSGRRGAASRTPVSEHRKDGRQSDAPQSDAPKMRPARGGFTTQWPLVAATVALVAATLGLVIAASFQAAYGARMAREQASATEATRALVSAQERAAAAGAAQASAVRRLTATLSAESDRLRAEREAENNALRRELVVELQHNLWGVQRGPRNEPRRFRTTTWERLRHRPCTDPETWGRLTVHYDVYIRLAEGTTATGRVEAIPPGLPGAGQDPASMVANDMQSGNDGLLKVFRDRFKIADAFPEK